MQLLRVCRHILRELKLASPLNEGGEQWLYISSAVRLGKTPGSDASVNQRGEKLLHSYLVYLRSSRQHRVSMDTKRVYIYTILARDPTVIHVYMMSWWCNVNRSCWRDIRVKVKGRWKRVLSWWDWKYQIMEQRLNMQCPNSIPLICLKNLSENVNSLHQQYTKFSK